MTPSTVVLRTAQVVTLLALMGHVLLAVLPPPPPPGSAEAVVALLRDGRLLEAAGLAAVRPAEGDTILFGLLTEDDRCALTEACLALGSRLLDRDELPTVEALLPRLGRLTGDGVPFRVLRGRVHEAARRAGPAEESFEAALTLDPACAEAVTRLADLRAANPDALYALGLRLGRARVTSPEPYLRLAERLEGAGRFHQARAVYDGALAAGSTDALVTSRREDLAAFMLARAPSLPDDSAAIDEPLATDAVAPSTGTLEVAPPPLAAEGRARSRHALEAITSQGYVGMGADELLRLAGEPTIRRGSRLPTTGLFAQIPRPERWDYAVDGGGDGVVVQVIDGKVTALSPYTRSLPTKGGGTR